MDRSVGPVGTSPQSIEGRNTQSAMIYVDDVDGRCAHARATGAAIVDEPADHDYGAVDPEGHLWWFTQRLRG